MIAFLYVQGDAIMNKMLMSAVGVAAIAVTGRETNALRPDFWYNYVRGEDSDRHIFVF